MMQINRGHFDQLPNCLILHIFKSLKLKDIKSVSTVCRRWNSLSKRDELWRNFLVHHDENIKHLMVIGDIDTQNSGKGELVNLFKSIYNVSEEDDMDTQDIYLVILSGENENETIDKLTQIVREDKNEILPKKNWEHKSSLNFKVLYENKEYMIHLTKYYSAENLITLNGFRYLPNTTFVVVKNKDKEGEVSYMLDHFKYIIGSNKYLILMNDDPIQEKIKVQDISLKWRQRKFDDGKKSLPKTKTTEKSLREEFEEITSQGDGNEMEVVSIHFDEKRNGKTKEDLHEYCQTEKQDHEEMLRDEEEEELVDDWTFLEIEKTEENKNYIELVKYKADEVIETNWDPNNISSALKHIIEMSIVHHKNMTPKYLSKQERNNKRVAIHKRDKDFVCLSIYILAFFSSLIMFCISPLYLIILISASSFLAMIKSQHYLFRSSRPLHKKILLSIPYIFLVLLITIFYLVIGVFLLFLSFLCCTLIGYSFWIVTQEGLNGFKKLFTFNFVYPHSTKQNRFSLFSEYFMFEFMKH